jgi:D-alanyl-D-alanine carboxypeptidase
LGPAILGTTYGTQPYATNVTKVTVRHLLQHTSGWTNAGGGDPMFMPFATHKEVIDYMIDTRPPMTPGISNS